MTFQTNYEPVPVIEAGEVIYQIEGDDLQSIYLRPRPDTLLLTREEVITVLAKAWEASVEHHEGLPVPAKKEWIETYINNQFK